MRKIAIIPTLLTLGNGVCGFASILAASQIPAGAGAAFSDPHFALAGWLIIAAMLFDSLDGYVARRTRTASKFGGELDSLCDAISFGVAPAFLLLRLGNPHPLLQQLITGIAVLYMVCAVLRLARFNVENTPDPASHKRFRGLPSPGAAGCIASLALLRGELPGTLFAHLGAVDADLLRLTIGRCVEVWAPAGALAVALLMVSRVPYPHATNQILRGKRHFGHLMQVILAGFVIVLLREMALAILFWAYALGMPLRYAILRGLRKTQVPTPSLDDVVRPH